MVLTNVATHHPHPRARPTRPCDAIEEDHYHHHANVVSTASLVYAVALNRMSLSLVCVDVEKKGLPPQLAGTECFHHLLPLLQLMMMMAEVSVVALESPTAAATVVVCTSFLEGPFQVLCALHGLT